MNKKKILIADDEKTVRLLLEARLSLHYQLFFADNGRDAVVMGKDIRPDLIIMDIMMPFMDGAEAAEHLQEDSSTAHIPILFLTALAEGEAGSTMVSSPRHKLLGKPFDADKLIQLIEQMTSGK